MGWLFGMHNMRMRLYIKGLTIWDAQYAHKIIDKGVDYMVCTICAKNYGWRGWLFGIHKFCAQGGGA